MYARPLRMLAVVAAAASMSIGIAPAHAASDATAKPGRAALAAEWQASQLTRGRIHNGKFDDWGLTIDTAFALAAQGGQPDPLARTQQAIQNNYFNNYAAPGDERYAGSFAKTLLYTAVFDIDPTDFDGHNVRAELLALVAPGGAGFEQGRVRDISEFGEFSNTFSQAYAVLGLSRTGDVPQPVVDYLLKQQCPGGFFRLTEVAGENCDATGSAPDVDATALAMQAMLAAEAAGADVPAHRKNIAVNWLVSAQRDSGGYRGGTSTPSVNVNSTGLAAVALHAYGRDRAEDKAAAFVQTLQLTRANTSGTLRQEVGAIAYNQAALLALLSNGMQGPERAVARRSTSQAIFAFVPKPLNTLSAS